MVSVLTNVVQTNISLNTSAYQIVVTVSHIVTVMMMIVNQEHVSLVALMLISLYNIVQHPYNNTLVSNVIHQDYSHMKRVNTSASHHVINSLNMNKQY